jgi:hypothetical protein
MRKFPSHGASFRLWDELENPFFISCNDAFHKRFSFILVMAKMLKQSHQSVAFVLLDEHVLTLLKMQRNLCVSFRKTGLPLWPRGQFLATDPEVLVTDTNRSPEK